MKVARAYLDSQISAHFELGDLIELGKQNLHERTVALKRLTSQKAKMSSYAQFETELIKIGLDSKIAEHESLEKWIASGEVHLNEVTTKLKALNLEEAEM